MKKTDITFTIMALSILVSTSFVYAGCRGGCMGMQGGGFRNAAVATSVSALPYVMPDENETAGLVKMREEEKLARDVYLTLNEQWKNVVFESIASSEQRHMDAIKAILDRYGIADPVTDDSRGVFQSADLQALYNKLVADGSVSLEQAFLVGATIEDLDIYDLNSLIAATDNEDMLVVYQNLVKGSRNHMRRFATELGALGITYTAQYLSQEEVDLIVSSAWERGRYDKDGNPVMSGRGGGRMGRMGGGNGYGACGMNFVDENANGICDFME